MPIIIRAKHEGFRRCGRPFSKTPTTFADDAFSDQDLKILKADSMLIVTIVEPEPVEGTGPDPKSKTGKKKA